jgi:alpha-beta hydrolase superfamily lysophospholipase
MGGNLALNYLLKHPEQVKAAVISSPWLALTKKPGYFTLLMGKLLVKAAPWLLQNNNLKASDLCHDTSICTRYENDPLIHWKISLKAFFVIEESAAYCMQHAPDVALPILLLHSQTDPITSFNTSEQFFKSANNFVEFRAFTGLLHELHNETTHPEILKGVVNWVLNAV